MEEGYNAPSYDEYSRFRRTDTPTDIETRIPVIEERLQLSKRASTDEAVITKNPPTDTKTLSNTVTSEKVDVEKEVRRKRQAFICIFSVD